MRFSRKCWIFEEKRPDIRVRSGICKEILADFRVNGGFSKQKPDFRVKSKICEEKFADFDVNGEISRRKRQIFGLYQRFAKRKKVIFTKMGDF